MKGIFLCIFLVLTLAACTEQLVSPDDGLALLKLETLPRVTHPSNNATSAIKVKLGKYLFYDPILSGEKDISCMTCHNPKYGYTDGLGLPIGVGGQGKSIERMDLSNGRIPIVGRNAPTIINASYNGLLSHHQKYNPLTAPMFWDGRRKSLESQSLGPPTSYNEMRGSGYKEDLTYDSIIARLKNIPEYVMLFNEAFSSDQSITEENIGKAIAAFERTILSTNSPYDQYVSGNTSALTIQQKQGLLLFYGKANCANCHLGPMFSDFNYYNLGIKNNPKRDSEDKGLNGSYAFRTPTLRNVTLTAPYMHNGMHKTLQEVMEYYNKGVSENPGTAALDNKIIPLDLSHDEVESIIAFMESLTDENFDKEELLKVPSGLKPGGN